MPTNKTRRPEIVRAVAKAVKRPERQVDQILRAFEMEVGRVLQTGAEVQLYNFGRFYPLEQGARNVRNPRTGKLIEIPANRLVKFKAAEALLAQARKRT